MTARGRVVSAVVLLGPALGVAVGTAGPASAHHPAVVRGTLTAEGVQCPALRGDDGALYTLTGDLHGYQAGDRVLVVGQVAHVNFCTQGTTIAVRLIDSSA